MTQNIITVRGRRGPQGTTGATGAAGADGAAGSPGSLFEGRLTLVSGDAVPTTDQTAAATLYVTPYNGNRVRLALTNDPIWSVKTFTEISIDASGFTAAKPYDVFLYWDSGTASVKAETLVWTNDTTRATALQLVEGVWTKNANATRLYVGTVYTSGAGTLEDSAVKRFVWNMYNRVKRSMLREDPAASWTYTTATLRQANANTANELQMVRGLDVDPVVSRAAAVSVNATASVTRVTGIGLDDTTAAATGNIAGQTLATFGLTVPSWWSGHPGVGYHRLTWLEYSTAAGTTTWYGTTNGGIMAEVMA